MTVWFVGSNPSTKNDCPLVPFVGTKSFDVLKMWINELGVDGRAFINASNQIAIDGKFKVTGDDLDRLNSMLKDQPSIVALGMTASQTLKMLDIKHFKLPHPSGRNRKLNDPTFIVGELAKCRAYLEEIRCNSIKMDSLLP